MNTIESVFYLFANIDLKLNSKLTKNKSSCHTEKWDPRILIETGTQNFKGILGVEPRGGTLEMGPERLLDIGAYE